VELIAHHRMLTAIASGLVGPADADDVVQETFLRALAQPPQDTSAPMAPWLVTVARNLAMDVLRRRGRFVELTEEDEGATSGLPAAEVTVPALLAGLGNLSEGEVAVLLLRDWMDFEVDEVAAALETSAGSVRVLHHRARRKAAEGAPLSEALSSLDRFLTWLLGRAVWGLPVVGGRVDDPGLTQGVLVAYLGLLDAMIDLARAEGDRDVEGRARLSRGAARFTLGRAGAVEDLELAIEYGAKRTFAEIRLAPILYTRGDLDRALSTALSALGRADYALKDAGGMMHRVAARVYVARGDSAAAEPHLAALRALGEGGAKSAYAAVASAAIAMDAERFEEARAGLLVALGRNRVATSSTRNEPGILSNLAFAALSMGELDEAAAWGAEGLALARSMGERRTEGLLLGNLASIAQLRGHLDEAAAGFERAVAVFGETEQRLNGDIYRSYAAVVAHQAGRTEEAAAALDDIVRRLADAPGVSLVPRIHLLAAHAELGRADERSFAMLEAEASGRPSLVRALALYRLLLAPDPVAIERALAGATGTAPADRIAVSILERVARTLRKNKRRRR
jgi:RNA polymerase sigma factor (sigma-70 family)